MDNIKQDPPRDDRAWPRWAVPVSVVVGLAAVAVGVAVTVCAEQHLASALFLLAGLLMQSSLLVFGIRRWLAGGAIGAGMATIGVSSVIAGSAIAQLTGGGGARAAFLAGSTGGMMLANVWAVRAARANRRQ